MWNLNFLKSSLTIILVIGNLGLVSAQFGDTLWISQSQMIPLDSFPTDAQSLSTDPLQNYFLAGPRPEVTKYNRYGKFLFRYSNNRLGPLTWMDAPNPFNIQLFFKEFQQLILLDNTLSELNTYDLIELGYYDASAVTISFDNNLWIFDAISGELRKIDDHGNILFASDNLFYQLDTDPEPLRLVESKKYILLLDKQQGFFLFDIFGKYLRQLDIPPTPRFQLRKDLLLFEENGRLNIYNLTSRSLSVLMLKNEGSIEENKNQKPTAKDIRLESNILYQLDEKYLRIFKIDGVEESGK